MLERRRAVRRAVVLAAAALALSACSNVATTTSSGARVSPGVASHSIVVGSLANITGPLAADFGPIVSGVRAYFDLVNARGGVDGRRLELKYALDDQSNPTLDTDLARTLVEQDHVFAVVGVATPFFSAARYLASQGVPTFGDMISTDWADGPSLFGAEGSYLSYAHAGSMFAWVAKQLHARSVGILSYAFSASQQPCVAAVNGFTRFGVHIGYQDLNINFGADMSSDVVHLKAARVDLVLSCMDITGNVSLARSLQQYGLGSVHQFWLDGYDRNDLKSYPSLMNGVIFLTLSVPFEAPSVFPGHYPGMQAYLATMRRYAPGYAYDNIALLGYLNARLFVSGLERAGPDPTRAKLITAINSIRDFTGGGIIGPVDWTIAHSSLTSEYWQCFVRAQNGRFVPTFTQGSRVFVWFRANSDTPVAAPPGTPGIMR